MSLHLHSHSECVIAYSTRLIENVCAYYVHTKIQWTPLIIATDI